MKRVNSMVIDTLLKRRPHDPDVWYQVAEVRGLSGNTIGLHQARGEFFALIGDYNLSNLVGVVAVARAPRAAQSCAVACASSAEPR